MRTIETAIQIAASPAAVWAVLIDFQDYPSWNPFIQRIEGQPVVGGRLTVRIVPPGRRGMTFRPRVLAAARERQLRWKGRLFLPGLVDGEHWFRLAPNARGCRFEQGEIFRGLLVGVLGSDRLRATEEGFHAMNEALKARVEERQL